MTGAARRGDEVGRLVQDRLDDPRGDARLAAGSRVLVDVATALIVAIP